MRKKSTSHKKTRSGCTSWSPKVHALYLFSQAPNWWGKYLPGFTHVEIILICPDEITALHIDPRLSFSLFTILQKESDIKLWAKNKTVVEARIEPTKANRLIRPIFQTCTTLIQYLCGISLGCITAQGLYKCLTSKDAEWLKKKGILEVDVWESKP